MNKIEKDFYVVARESGAENNLIPTWATNNENQVNLSKDTTLKIKRIEVDNLPGTFQLLNILSKEECIRFINQTDTLGYVEDAAVSLPRSVRHNNSLTWVIDDTIHDIIWNRVKDFMFDKHSLFNGKKALGLNKRFRFYKYKKEDFFKVHSDGAWPGSAVINKEIIADAYPDRFSQMTFLIFLSEDFEGGATQFLTDKNNPSKPARNIVNTNKINIRTPAGGVLCFPHGSHPLHCLHSSEKILSGLKYIIRTDVLFEK
ncbi:oxidoreductase [Poseidonibacter ostreae]|uniref:Oxidoreductase n=1 Tax=Poseidonibacter ostreae TaxID=2654171 RepID=A0A6L4WUC0_9BACT|nr:oxidoreductase [Poseidonibacter ostreae]KAB7888859.1 oxidoreductase [Poseidonibacter ostreae]KAB7889650.1 oxidoreductase [Poseidonibacter ostreae]